MGNLWQFFGLPDPEIIPQTVVKNPVQNKLENILVQRKLIQDEAQVIPTGKSLIKTQKASVNPPTITVTTNLPKGWKGPTTPDGDAFHDMSMHKSTQKSNFLPKALRYVCPDQMHRLPLDSIGKRISEGDTIIVDIRPLIHMDAHKDACRRQLRRLGDDLGIAIFALDDQDQLLLLPGRDVVVDISKHELGLTPMLL
jgi:hypothetical protein